MSRQVSWQVSRMASRTVIGAVSRLVSGVVNRAVSGDLSRRECPTERAKQRGRYRGAPARYWLACLMAVAPLLGSCSRTGPEPYVRVRDHAPPSLSTEGGPALVAFWASWCPPCVQEVDALRALAATRVGGLRLVVISVEEDPALARAAFGPAVEVRADADRQLLDALRVGELPVAFLVAEGRVVARFDGARDWNGLPMRGTLEKLIREVSP